MLDGDRRIMALRHLARTSPDTEVSVEPLPIPIRSRMKAREAYARMQGVKNTDRVFLSRGGWLPNYGDAVVVKRLSPGSVARGERLNSIPEEYTTGRALSLCNNAEIFVPDEVLDDFRTKYPGIRFRGRNALPLRRKYPNLIMNKASLRRDEKKTFIGKVNGQDMDVVLAYGPKAEKFRKAFEPPATGSRTKTGAGSSTKNAP